MQVLLDGQVIEVKAPTLAAALEAGRAAAMRARRVLVEAQMDGVRVPDAILENPDAAGPGGSEIRFTSADPGALVGQTLRDAAEVLGEARKAQGDAADLIDGSQFDRAMPQLSAALGAWEQSRLAVVNGMALLGKNLETVRVIGGTGAGSERPLAEWVGSLTLALEEVRRSLKAQDWVGLSDVLRYDLSEQAELWRAMLGELARSVEGAA